MATPMCYILLIVCLLYIQQSISKSISKDEHQQYDDRHQYNAYEKNNNNEHDVTAYHGIRPFSNNINFNTHDIQNSKYDPQASSSESFSPTTSRTTTRKEKQKEKEKERNGFPVEEILMY